MMRALCIQIPPQLAAKHPQVYADFIAAQVSQYSLNQSLTHSLTHSLIHSFTHSFTHLLTHLLTH